MTKETRTIYVRINPDLHRAVLIAAYDNRRKIGAQLEVIIENWLRWSGITPPATRNGSLSSQHGSDEGRASEVS